MCKVIDMKVERCGNKGWYNDGTREFKRVSRWLKVRQNYNPNKKNSLWEYVMDESGYRPHNKKFNPKNGLYLDYFRFNGRNFAVEQFLALGNPFYTALNLSYEEKGKTFYLCGMEENDLCHPIFIEMRDEMVRVYEEVA